MYYLKKNQGFGIEEIQGISRSELNLSPRKCFLCDEEARICSRGQSHSFKDINRYFEKKFEEYNLFLKEKETIAYEISQYALKAMIAEVSTMPSFGLVSPCTMGSHRDMDYYTFIDSSFAIAPYLMDMAMIGYSYHQPKEIFEAIRFIGMESEKAMFHVTKGVNTHKGMIFLLGIIVAATMKAIYEQSDFHCIEHILKEMCANILDDFKDIQDKGELTHGERLFKEYGFTGVRGEVKSGLPVVFKEVLPTYLESNLRGHALYAQTLLELMARVEDSTIVHRQDIHKLREIQGKSKEILKIGGLNSKDGIKVALEFEEECIKANVSPGGSADLLALIIFLGEVYNKYFK